jgi:hypothetical protein
MEKLNMMKRVEEESSRKTSVLGGNLYFPGEI